MIFKMLAMILSVGSVFAGQERGNGGDAVVCFDQNKKIISVELLDLVEGRLFKNMKYDFIDSQNYINIAKKQVDKMKVLSPRRHALYIEKLEAFEDEAVIVHGVNLKDIDDSDHRIIPKNCEVEQLIEQKEPSYPGDKRYTINGDLWDLLPVSHKAATATHEIFYWEINSPTSVKVRRINALLNSTNFAAMNSELWLVHQYYAGVPLIEYEGNEFLVQKLGNDPVKLFAGRSIEPVQNALKPFGVFKGRDYSGFGHVEIDFQCTLTACKFGKRKAQNPLALGAGRKLGLNLADDLIPDEVIINEKNEFESANVRAFKTGTPFSFQGVSWELKAQTKLQLQFQEGRLWQVRFLPDYGRFFEMGVIFKGYKGTQSLILEDGILKVTYSSGETAAFPITNESISDVESPALEISTSGQITSLKLRPQDNVPARSYALPMSDGTSQRVCLGERIIFDENLRVLLNPNWKLLETGYGEYSKCLGLVRR